MMRADDLPRIYAFGSQLDAWAARISRNLGRQLPEYQAQLEKNRLDELAHARILADLTTYAPESNYSRIVGGSALSDRPDWNALMLNFVERRSEVQFRLAWRLTRNGDLLQIANDEARHIKFGREILKALNVQEPLVALAKRWLDRVDVETGTQDIDGLRRLNQLVYNELTER